MSKVIIDVREPHEFSSGHVTGAINIPLNHLLTGSKHLTNLPKDTEIILYCRTGNRSAIGKNYLQIHGYTKVVNGFNQAQIEYELQRDS